MSGGQQCFHGRADSNAGQTVRPERCTRTPNIRVATLEPGDAVLIEFLLQPTHGAQFQISVSNP